MYGKSEDWNYERSHKRAAASAVVFFCEIN